jgi:tetratricopeptide (TPR) repeat protein
MPSAPPIPGKYRVLASLVPFLIAVTVISTVVLFRWRAQYGNLAREKRGREAALLPLERARELVERVEKLARLAKPDFTNLRSLAEEAVNSSNVALSAAESEEGYRTRGRALELMYNLDEAREDYEKASSMHPASLARFHLGALAARRLARAALADLKASLEDLETLRARAVRPLNAFLGMPPEFHADVDEKLRFLARMCAAYAQGEFKHVPAAADMAGQFDETEWTPPYFFGLALRELKRPADAAAELEDASRLAPGVADPHAALGVLYRELGRRADAIAELGTALEADPHFLEAYLLRGTILFEDGRFTEARLDFEKCVLLRNVPELHLKLAIASQESWLGTGRTDSDALEAAEKALGAYVEARPTEAEGWLRRARVRLAKGNADGAEEDLKRVFGISPSLPDASEILGDAHETRKRWADAEKAYSAAIEKSGDPARVASILRKRARARASAGRTDEALADLDALLARDPGDAGLIHEKAKLQADAGKLDDALATLHRALETPRANARLRVLRAEVLARRGDTAGAIREATAAYDADPLLAEALVARGRAFLAAGNKAEAAADFEKALLIRADLKAEVEPLLRQARP